MKWFLHFYQLIFFLLSQKSLIIKIMFHEDISYRKNIKILIFD